ncbi:restriction endonuclease [Acidovorax sp. A1169]|uniref:restriction endonuclease n=1 Tax=Acidovorax sp. A1169 TaxID=3059524 RepID=UPI002737D3DA|nr:restriction endonuclease [Acidovorax sp. A1169]MDP4077523.1 restriction endonuclease [Acidovorax sp. A1169]
MAARHKKTSPLEDMMDLVALLPWWAGLGLAVVFYLVLSPLAASFSQPAPVKPGQIGAMVQGALLGGLAMVGQYVVPMVCLAGAALSGWRRRQRRALVDEVAQAPAASTIDGMSWAEFEMLVGEAYRLQGFQVTETGGGGPDGGVDLVLTRGGEKFFVQCKHWKAFKVGVETVRELYGVMAARGATGGFVVTSGRFTNDARLFTQGRNLQLVDGPRLLAMLQQAQQSRSAVAAVIAAHGGVHHEPPAPPSVPSGQAAAVAPADASASAQPGCPKCGCGMVRRIARTGNNAGNSFWGCSTFPACRGVRQVD